jgi:hypothetical protein
MAVTKSFLFGNVINLYIFCFMSKMTRHLKNLIFDSLSFTEGLITSLSTTDGEAPAFNRMSANSVWPFPAAKWSGVWPYPINIKQYLKTNNFSVNHRHIVIKSSQATRLYITQVFFNNSVVMVTLQIIFRQKCS